MSIAIGGTVILSTGNKVVGAVCFTVGLFTACTFGIVTFILCGFEHCVANMYYFSMTDMWSLKALGYVLIMTLGNAAGGVIIPLLRKWKEKTT
ncbi:MAG: formate/nitrite transporter family protein [Oscillospiraceae bacterium]|nr:formate/nitrite transporter family protein [Oscillospiraceae bacterium]